MLMFNMDILLHVLLDCSVLLLFLKYPVTEASRRNPWVTAENSYGARSARSAEVRPTPVNCKMRNWSRWTPCTSCTDRKVWTPCTSCTDRKYRFRSVEKPSQYGGSECLGMLWDERTCPTATTPCLVDDYCGDSFTCEVSGRCISRQLQCNGEPDCQHDNDETNCTKVNYRSDKCSTFQPVPGAIHGTQGFNVLTGDFVDKVLDPDYFGETCEYVYNGEWRKFTYDSFCENLNYNDLEKNYRKPYNYHTYQFMAEASSEGTDEYFEDMVQLLKARKEGGSFNLGLTVGIGPVAAGVKGSRESEFLKNLTSYKAEDVGFVRLLSKVQTAWFKMRSEKLMLHEDMYQSLMELPVSYDFGFYARFLTTYGTHYVTEGSMGGTLEYILVTNKKAMASSRLEASQVSRCIGGSIGLNTPLGKSKQVEAGVTAHGEDCRKSGNYSLDKKGSTNPSEIIQDAFTLVRGGTIQRGVALVPLRDPDTYRKWGKTLQYNPTLIDYEIMPIYELVRLSTAADHVGQRLAHLRRAWEEYLQEFNTCRCGPCRNNGLRALIQGTACECICKKGFRGSACEDKELARPAEASDGAWSCWGPWSACQSGRKTRTRLCNNPAPDSGGAPCLGTASQAQGC